MKLELLPPDKISNIISEEVSVEEAKELYDDFENFTSLCKSKGGVGLAAPQVGIFKRMFVWNNGEGFKMVFNPHIYKEGNGRLIITEGCITFDDTKYNVVRWKDIRVVYQIFDGEKFLRRSKVLHRIQAAVFQHETDHLNGKTIAMVGEEVKEQQKVAI